MLQQLFYITGTTYFTLSLILLIAIVMALILIYFRLKNLKKEIPQKVAPALAAASFIKSTKIGKFLPFLAIIPVFLKALEEFKSRK